MKGVLSLDFPAFSLPTQADIGSTVRELHRSTLAKPVHGFRDLKGLPAEVADRLVRELEVVAAHPHGRHPKAQAMKGKPPTFRLRVGDHRAVYSIDRQRGAVIVTRVGDRKEIYR